MEINYADLEGDSKASYLILSFYIGFSGFIDLAIMFYLKDDLMLTPSETTRLLAIALLPWSIKPIYGIISDFNPIYGFRRKPYILITTIGISLFWLLMIRYNSYYYMLTFLVLINVGKAFLSVISQSLMVESARYDSFKEIKMIVGQLFFIKNFGTLIGAMLRGYIVQKFSYAQIFCFASLLPLMNIASIFLFDESPIRIVNKSTLKDETEERQIMLSERLIKKEETVESQKAKNTSNEKSAESIKVKMLSSIKIQHTNFKVQSSKVESNNKDNSGIGEEIRKDVATNQISQNYFDDPQENKYISCKQYGDEGDKISSSTSMKIGGEQIIDEDSFMRDYEENFANLRKAIRSKKVYYPLIFILILFSTPNYFDPFFYFITNKLNFTPVMVSYLAIISTLGICISISIYMAYFQKFDSRYIILIGSAFSIIFHIGSYGIVEGAYAHIGVSAFALTCACVLFISIVGEIAMLPFLSLAATICPKKLEATVYSIFLSAFNISIFFSSIIGSYLANLLSITATDFTNLSDLICICALWTILSISCLFILDTNYIEIKRSDAEGCSEENQEAIANEINIAISPTKDEMLHKNF